MKMRVLVSSDKGKMMSMGQLLAEKYNCKLDVIPPPYSCDKERLVIIGASVSGDLPNSLVLFAKDMSKQRAQNVALFLEGKESVSKELISYMKEAGANVIDNVFWCKSGFLMKFFKGVPGEEKEALFAWADNVMKSLA